MAKVEKHRQSPTSKDLVIISVPSFFNTTHTHTNISWSSWWSCLLNSPGNLKKSEEKNIPNLLPSHHPTQQHLHPGTLPSLLSWAWTVGVLCKANPSTCPPGRFLSLIQGHHSSNSLCADFFSVYPSRCIFHLSYPTLWQSDLNQEAPLPSGSRLLWPMERTGVPRKGLGICRKEEREGGTLIFPAPSPWTGSVHHQMTQVGLSSQL